MPRVRTRTRSHTKSKHRSKKTPRPPSPTKDSSRSPILTPLPISHSTPRSINKDSLSHDWHSSTPLTPVTAELKALKSGAEDMKLVLERLENELDRIGCLMDSDGVWEDGVGFEVVVMSMGAEEREEYEDFTEDVGEKGANVNLKRIIGEKVKKGLNGSAKKVGLKKNSRGGVKR